MRLPLPASLLCVSLLACGGKHDDKPPPPPPKRDAGVVAVDWTACERTLRALPAALDGAAIAKLVDGCRVCGDWTPLLDWNRRAQDGGPTRLAIEDAMARCGYCDATAKQYFLGTLDDARGTDSRKPWKVLGDECKAKASAVPDSRYVSAPYYALDRIGRAAAAHGGDVEALVGKLDVPLPALTLTGIGVELPTVDVGAAVPIGTWTSVTLLGGQVLVGKVPRGKLGAAGVTVDYGGTPYPGAALDLHLATAKPIFFRDVPTLAVFASKQLPAVTLLDVVAEAALSKTAVRLAVDPGNALRWPIPSVLATELVPGTDVAIDDAMTVDDLVAAIAKLGKPRVGLARAKAKAKR